MWLKESTCAGPSNTIVLSPAEIINLAKNLAPDAKKTDTQ